MSNLRGYSEEDFDAMMFNVMRKKNRTRAVLSHFPQLAEHKEFNAELSLELRKHRTKIIRFVILAYDKNSPLRKIEDLIERNIMAGLLAGFTIEKKTNHKHFNKEIDLVLKGFNETVNRMIVRYCRMQGSTRFAMIMSARDTFYDLVHRVLKKSDDDGSSEAREKFKLLSAMEDSLKNIDDMSRNFFQSNDNEQLVEDLYVIIEEEDKRSLRIGPESRLNVS